MTSNPLATTGRYKMAQLGARLIETYGTARNTTRSITIHQIDVPALLRMFESIFMQFLGDKGGNKPITSSIAPSLAYDAAVATAAVCYYKAYRQDPMIAELQSLLPVTSSTFPAYIAALINSIGPVQPSGIHSNRIHIPFIDTTSLEQNRPADYEASHFKIFMDARRDKLIFTNIESDGEHSSAWWALWPVEFFRLNRFGYDRTKMSLADFNEWTVFSPVQFDEVENHLKPAVIFAGKPLSKSGFGPWSATHWYERDDLQSFVGSTPSPADFPPETREFPAFWDNAANFHAEVETRFIRRENLGNNAAPLAAGQQQDSSEPNQPKRRKLQPAQDNSLTTASGQNNDGDQDGCIQQYRIVYQYFDHVSIKDFTLQMCKRFVHQACQID